MTNGLLDPDALIKELGHPGDHLWKLFNMPTAEMPRQGPKLNLRPSSLGVLDRLPAELIEMVLDQLDVHSISKFARLSFRGYEFARAHTKYQTLVRLVPQTLLALGRHGNGPQLLQMHSVAKLDAVLRSERCATCPYFGSYIFLPTCERCCWNCLVHNPAFYMVTVRDAQEYFGLAAFQARKLPVVYGPYHYNHHGQLLCRRERYVSAQSAREMGIWVRRAAVRRSQRLWRTCRTSSSSSPPSTKNGSNTNTNNPNTNNTKPSTSNMNTTTNWEFHQPFYKPIAFGEGLEPGFRPPNFRHNPHSSNRFNEFGIASLPFPSLTKSGRVERGLCCQGCQMQLVNTLQLNTNMHLNLNPSLDQSVTTNLPQHLVDVIVPRGCNILVVLHALASRSWTTLGFLEHVKQCWAARVLVPELATHEIGPANLV